MRRKSIRVLFMLGVLASFVSNAATTYTSSGSGNWSTSFTSSGTGSPISYVIMPGDTITVDVNGTTGIDTLRIYGVLNFSNGRKIDMTTTGIIYLESGGVINSGNAGSKFRFPGGTDIAGPFNLNGPLQATGATGGSFVNTPLPVEWLGFDIVKTSNQLTLSWQTASELNNSYFVVQYSQTGTEWLNGPTVMSKAVGGNSNEILSYSHSSSIDDFTFQNGKCFFRIKQVDFDSKMDYSDVKVITAKSSNKISAIQLNNNQFTTNMKSTSEEVNIKVLKLDGSLVLDENVLPSKEFELVVPGMYLILFEMNGEMTTQKIIVH